MSVPPPNVQPTAQIDLSGASARADLLFPSLIQEGATIATLVERVEYWRSGVFEQTVGELFDALKAEAEQVMGLFDERRDAAIERVIATDAATTEDLEAKLKLAIDLLGAGWVDHREFRLIDSAARDAARFRAAAELEQQGAPM